MTNEENTKKESVEEMAAKLAEGLNEEQEATVETTEEVIEETIDENAEEKVEDSTEETVQEEVKEEVPEEPSQVEPAKKNRKKTWMIVGIAVAAFVLIVGGIYFFIAKKYDDRFLMNTYVNEMDCSGMTIKEVEKLIQKQVEEYNLTITGVNDTSEEIKGTDIGIKYIGYSQLKEAFKAQNAYAWPKAMLKDNQIKVEVIFEFDQEKLNAAVAGLNCMKAENQVAPVAATVVYKDNAFVIQDEVYGTQIDTEKFTATVNESVNAIRTTLDLEESGCYLQPKFTKDSAEVAKAKDAMNEYLNAEITWSLDGVEMSLDRSTFASWISVDENMEPVVSSSEAANFAKKIANQYNTANRAGVLVTPLGKSVQLNNASLGRAVGTDSERDQIISEIKAGKKISRQPIISRQAMKDGEYVWGTTYIEVDISEQYMWYIVNGSIVLETPVVTGKKGRNDTPTGIYNILEKQRNKTLVGRIVNGKPLYRTPVSYWMRVTWSGIGFHDASWQPTFGGDRYVSNGSHGCINMPPAKAGELYNLISKGTSVIIHY